MFLDASCTDHPHTHPNAPKEHPRKKDLLQKFQFILVLLQQIELKAESINEIENTKKQLKHNQLFFNLLFFFCCWP